MKKSKNRIKMLVAFILGIAVTGGGVAVYAAISSSNVTYTDTYNIGATNVKDALDKLYTRAAAKKSNFVAAYTYNASSCVTGLEPTCVKTECYKTKSANACPAGTIIQYRVNDQKIETFHVMYDDASTITMQAQKNTIYNTAWITKLDYSGSSAYGNNKGPLTILPALESATAGWSNVNDQTYTIGDDSSSTNLGYSGCTAYNACSANTYTLASRTAKSRMITIQEAAALGCTNSNKSCPNWMSNYLINSTRYGGTVNDTSHGPSGANNSGYLTLSANSSAANGAWTIDSRGVVSSSGVLGYYYGARAVVKVSK